MCCVAIGTNAYPISQETALQLVKTNRTLNNLSNSGVNFYIAQTDTIINNFRCEVDMSTVQQQWLRDSSPKWLVFVDEDPLQPWSHSCKYYYVQRNPSLVPTVKHFQGIVPPTDCGIVPVEKNVTVDNSHLQAINFPSHPMYAPGSGANYTNPYADSTYVVLSSLSYTDETLGVYWRDLSAMYQMLTTVYQIPKSHIKVVYDDSSTTFFNDLEYRDLDLDGENEDVQPFSNYIHILDSLSNPEIYPDCRHIFVFIDTDLMLDDGLVTGITHRLRRYNVPGSRDKFLSMMLRMPQELAFRTNNQKLNNVMMTPGDSGMEPNDLTLPCSSPLIYKWICAMSGKDLQTGETLNADTNNDGVVTMDEACTFALHDANRPYMEDALLCESTPDYLGHILAFDSLPDMPNLVIRDNPEDIGSEPNTASEITWHSPDISVGDGIHAEYTNGENVCISVRVHNKGRRAYNGQGYKLYVARKRPDIKQGHDVDWDCDGIVIDSIPITCNIEPDSSTVITVRTDYSFIDSEECGGIFCDNVIACVAPQLPAYLPVYMFEAFAEDMPDPASLSNLAISKHIAVMPTRGTLSLPLPSSHGTLAQIYRPGVCIPLELNGGSLQDPCSLEIQCTDPSKSDYSSFKVKVGVSQDMLDYWKTNGAVKNGFYHNYCDSTEFVLSAANACIQDIVSGFNYIELTITDAGTVPMDDNDYEFNLILRDGEGNTIDGTTFSLHLKGSGGGIIGPIIRAVNDGNGNVGLTAGNVNGTATLEWLGGDDTLLGTDNMLQLDPTNLEHVYFLRATDEQTAQTGCASLDMDKVNFITSVKSSGDDIVVGLWKDAVNGTSVRIIPANGTGSVCQANATSGESSVIVNMPAGSGIYVVALLINGDVIDTVNITK